MARPVVGIYARVAPASWGPWVDRPSVLAPVELGAAVRRAGGIAVLIAPSADPEGDELLRMLDALVVCDDADGLDALLAAARERKLGVVVVDAGNPDPTDEVAGELSSLLAP